MYQSYDGGQNFALVPGGNFESSQQKQISCAVIQPDIYHFAISGSDVPGSSNLIHGIWSRYGDESGYVVRFNDFDSIAGFLEAVTISADGMTLVAANYLTDTRGQKYLDQIYVSRVFWNPPAGWNSYLGSYYSYLDRTIDPFRSFPSSHSMEYLRSLVSLTATEPVRFGSVDIKYSTDMKVCFCFCFCCWY